MEEYQQGIKNSQKVQKLLDILFNKKATYDTAHKFSVEVGTILTDLLSDKLTLESLGLDEMYWNVAQRVLFETLEENHNVVSEYSQQVQSILNERANIKLKPKKVDFDKEGVESIAGKLVSAEDFEKVVFLLKEPIITHSMRIVDRTLLANADFQKSAGLQPKIKRTLGGRCCDWCASLVGEYDYTPEINMDVFKRHDRCRCKVEYVSVGLKSQTIHQGDGSLTAKTRRKGMKYG